MNDLITFLRERLDEDKDHAQVLTNAAKFIDAVPDFYGAGGPAAQDYWQHFTPARMLADAGAKRRILALHEPLPSAPDAPADPPVTICRECGPNTGRHGEIDPTGRSGDHWWPCPTLRLLALPYAGHPDYRQEWAP